MKLRIRFILSICLVLSFFLNVGTLSGQSLKLNAFSDLERIFDDGYKLPPSDDTLKLSGLRGEIVSGQAAIQSKKKLTAVTVNVSDFIDENGRKFPAEAVEWNFVGSIPLSVNTPNQPLTAVARKAPALFPDYLMVEKQVDIKEKSWQSVWITINIPENVTPGDYNGTISLESGQGNANLPVSLTIHPLILPSKRNLKVTEWYSTGNFEKFHGITERYSSEWFDMLRKYAENMAAHRQNVFNVPMNTIVIQKDKSGILHFDFSRFDQIARVFWDTKNMDYLETGELARFGKNAWFSSDIVLQQFNVSNAETGKEETMNGEDVIPFLLPAFESHLRSLGWLDKTYFHIKDEPSMHNSIAWREVSEYMHKLAPDLVRMDAIETTNILDDIEIAVPKLDAFGTWYDSYKTAHLKGLELWFYTVGIYQGSLFPNKTIDMPLIDSRLMHWLNYKYDATGYLHWGWNHWTDDPYKETGMHIGDGWHVYPVKDGVINSLRWEQMRNGIQDYECFLLLENKVRALKDSLGSRAAWIDPKSRSKELAGRVVMTIQDHSDDPEVLYQARKQLISDILDFNKSPRVYIQTNPSENSTLSKNSSVEVFGWTEPGTRILINGRLMPVNDQGYFFEQFGGDLIDTTKIPITKGSIRVNASGPNGTREIVRDFIIK